MKLIDWQLGRLAGIHAGRREYGRGRDDVTVLIYFFCREADATIAFPAFECAVRETWLRCGMMKTVIVVNKIVDCVRTFAATFPEWIEVQVEPSLVPGSTKPLSLDCISKLYLRFSTPYVLTIQNDGFPLRDGLDEFVGKYDFIGAPSVRDERRKWLNVLGFPCLNGGFSLRSRRICEAAAKSWSRVWRHLISVDSRFFAEDTFYTVAACLNPLYRWRFRFAGEREAFAFSYESLNDMITLPTNVKPFGFHGQPTAARMLFEGRFFG